MNKVNVFLFRKLGRCDRLRTLIHQMMKDFIKNIEQNMDQNTTAS